MKMTTLGFSWRKTLVGTLLLGVAVPAIAHHAFGAEFDFNRPLRLSGQVVKVEWVNPHAWIHLDGSDGVWMIEATTPNNLLRRGITRESLSPGTFIVVHGYQARDGSSRAHGRYLTFEDGSRFFMGSSGTGAPDEGLIFCDDLEAGDVSAWGAPDDLPCWFPQ